MINTKYNYQKYISLACLILMLFLIVLSIGTPTAFAFADTFSASNVLDDLRQADNFDVGYYPPSAKDYSISVIQIAETTSKELLVYVYQPSGSTGNIIASSINISETDDLDFKNYILQYVNSEGVFYKYVVKDFTVSNSGVRYYYVSSIYRPFIQGVDVEANNDNTISEVAFEVGKQYRFAELNGESYCDVVDIETIEITDKFVGFVRYFDGFAFGAGYCDSHFIAFSTDKPIDKLLEADVYYTTQRYNITDYNIEFWIWSDKTTYYDKKDGYASLTYTQDVTHKGEGWWGAGTYTWDRIETVEQFFAENDITQNVYSGAIFNVTVANKITDEGKKSLENKQWVLRFLETPFSISSLGSQVSNDLNGTMVGDVSILRLKFETDGEVYNLGVIDNKQTGSINPINVEQIKAGAKSFWEFIQWLVDHTGIPAWAWITIIILVPLVVILVVLSIVFPPFWSFLLTIFKGIAAFFKALWWLIKLPFRGLKALIEKIRDR